MVQIDLNASYNVTRANTNFHSSPVLHATRTMREYVLIYILEGSWTICVNDVEYTPTANQVIILPPNVLHYGTKPCTPKTKTMFMHILPLASNFSENKAELPTVIDCAKNYNIKRLFENAILTYCSNEIVKSAELEALFKLIVCELAKITTTKNQSVSNIANQAIKYIQNNPNVFYTLAEMAAKLFVSPKTLSSKFRLQTGKSFHEYQMETKLQLSKTQLTQFPDSRIKQVAANFGFYDEFHYSKQFKKRFGISPKDYRKSKIKTDK